MNWFLDIRLSLFVIELVLASCLFTHADDWQLFTYPKRLWRLLVFPALIVAYSCMPVPVLYFIQYSHGTRESVSGSLVGILYYTLTAIIVMCCINYASKMSTLKILVVVASGYSVQHLAFDVHTVITKLVYVARTDASFSISDVYYVVIYSSVFFVSWLCVGRRFNFDEHKVRRAPLWTVVCIALLLMLIFINLLYIQTVHGHAQIALYMYDAVATAFAIAAIIQASHNTQLSYDLQIMQRMDELQERHYEIAKENIALINEVGHDVRRSLRDAQLTSAAENAIHTYDSLFHTGSDALDVLLTERSLYCNSHNIVLTALADGAQLRNISPGTIYSLFGNLLDNSIEHIEKYASEQTPGVVDVSVRRTGNLILVEITNPLHGDVQMKDGLPVSSKAKTKDSALHGFGTRSVRRQVHNLGGEMTISTKNNEYRVSIVLPLVAEQ